jgi:hypothetical protein
VARLVGGGVLPAERRAEDIPRPRGGRLGGHRLVPLELRGVIRDVFADERLALLIGQRHQVDEHQVTILVEASPGTASAAGSAFDGASNTHQPSVRGLDRRRAHDRPTTLYDLATGIRLGDDVPVGDEETNLTAPTGHDTPHWIDAASRMAGRTLTPDEWSTNTHHQEGCHVLRRRDRRPRRSVLAERYARDEISDFELCGRRAVLRELG